MERYRLWCIFPQFQWPLRDGGYLEVRTQRLDIVARIPAVVLEAYIGHMLDGLAMQAYLTNALSPAWRGVPPARIELPRKPLATARLATGSPEQRTSLRDKRRSRRRSR